MANEVEIVVSLNDRTQAATAKIRGEMRKLGAEGVLTVGLKSGHGVALKIADGNLRAAPLVALALLHRNSLITNAAYAELKTALAVKAMGGAQVLGEMKALVD